METLCEAEKKVKRIGILTGGGDCPGLNAVIRAVARPALTKSSISPEVLKVYGFLDSYVGLVYGRYLELDLENTSGLLTMGGTILHTSNKDNPFAMVKRKKGISPKAICLTVQLKLMKRWGWTRLL